MENLNLYTDGSCIPNPGIGGWSFVIVDDAGNKKVTKKGHDQQTTNNRMEMQAVLEGLQHFLNEFSDKNSLTLHSDSRYLINGIVSWADDWAKKNWKKSNGDAVLNQDLWEKIRALKQKINLKCVFVKGHSGHELNELVDQLASEAQQECTKITTQLSV